MYFHNDIYDKTEFTRSRYANTNISRSQFSLLENSLKTSILFHMTLTSYENFRTIICRSVALHRFVNHVITLLKNDEEELTEEYQVRKQHDIYINNSYMNSNKTHMR